MELGRDISLEADAMDYLPAGPELSDFLRPVGFPPQKNPLTSVCMGTGACGVETHDGVTDEWMVIAEACEVARPLGLAVRWRYFEYRPLFKGVDDRLWGDRVLHGWGLNKHWTKLLPQPSRGCFERCGDALAARGWGGGVQWFTSEGAVRRSRPRPVFRARSWDRWRRKPSWLPQGRTCHRHPDAAS